MRDRDVDVEDQIAAVIRRLTTATEQSQALEVEAEVRRCFGEWADAPVREFVPIFAERCVRQRLGLRSTPEFAPRVVASR